MKNMYVITIFLFMFPLISFGDQIPAAHAQPTPNNTTVYNTSEKNLASTETSIELSRKLSSANATNYQSAQYGAGITVENCTDLEKTLQGGLPPGWIITSAEVAIDTTIECKLVGPGPTYATFTATGVMGLK
jgi:hypothetical protein